MQSQFPVDTSPRPLSENDSADTMSSTSSFTCPTPPATDDFQNSDDILLFNSTPTPGSWHLIRIQESGKYLSVIDGKACLQERPHPWGGIRWRCVNTNGWFGFHEFTSGRYLGHVKGNIVVIHPSHWEQDYIAVSHQPGGGYHLSIFAEDRDGDHGSGRVVRRLKPLKSDNGGSLLPLDHGGHAAIWEFCEIESPKY
jgi:hypothetical protein